MTEITAAAQLQAWLDGTAPLSKSAVRTVLWDLAEAQSSLAEALNFLGAQPHGSPHIIEVTVGTDPFSPDAVLHTVHHPLTCHRLSYGEYCDFDSVVTHHKLDFPDEAGRYEAHVEDWDTGAELMLERLDEGARR